MEKDLNVWMYPDNLCCQCTWVFILCVVVDRTISCINWHTGKRILIWFCLVCSEQVLHLWLETLCSCVDVVEKWYHPWSYVRSPGWVQIKCELRLGLRRLLSLRLLYLRLLSVCLLRVVRRENNRKAGLRNSMRGLVIAGKLIINFSGKLSRNVQFKNVLIYFFWVPFTSFLTIQENFSNTFWVDCSLSGCAWYRHEWTYNRGM